mmetsp:Transcript_83079/g.182528  ORF Transcript_83079/g.182528 Transcript_83079/m.182528 type:complete len:101 (-) Transcript_83079:278-580(-)
MRKPGMPPDGLQNGTAAAWLPRQLIASEAQIQQGVIPQHALSEHADAGVVEAAPIELQRLQFRPLHSKCQCMHCSMGEGGPRKVKLLQAATWPGDFEANG